MAQTTKYIWFNGELVEWDKGQTICRLGVSPFGRQAIALEGLAQILAYPLALFIDIAEFEQGDRVTLLRGEPIPVCRHQVILEHTLAGGIKIAHATLGVCIPLFGSLLGSC